MFFAFGAAAAEPTDDQMTDFTKDVHRIANCEVVAASQIRLGITTAMMISAAAPDENRKKALVTFYLAKVHDAAVLIENGDRLLKKMASSAGLDPENISNQSDKIVGQLDQRMAIAMTNAALNPKQMAVMMVAVQQDMGGCAEWIGERGNSP